MNALNSCASDHSKDGCDENLDIALGIPAAKTFAVNCIKGCEKPILFIKWLPHALSHRFERLKKIIIIEGASSGITASCVIDMICQK